MTGYNSEGAAIDRKGYNFHISARPVASPATAGVLGFGAVPSGEIPAGAIVIAGANGAVDISVGADNEVLLGVAIDAREKNDVRPVTYTWFGYCRLIAGSATVNAGSFIQPDDDASGDYYGCAKTWADDLGTGADAALRLIAHKKKIGKALTTATSGNSFEAYVNFAGV